MLWPRPLQLSRRVQQLDIALLLHAPPLEKLLDALQRVCIVLYQQ